MREESYYDATIVINKESCLPVSRCTLSLAS